MELTGNYRFIKGWFGSSYLEVEYIKLVDDDIGYGVGTHYYHERGWRKASKSDEKELRLIQSKAEGTTL